MASEWRHRELAPPGAGRELSEGVLGGIDGPFGTPHFRDARSRAAGLTKPDPLAKSDRISEVALATIG
jgi:hypothetical protein